MTEQRQIQKTQAKKFNTGEEGGRARGRSAHWMHKALITTGCSGTPINNTRGLTRSRRNRLGQSFWREKIKRSSTILKKKGHNCNVKYNGANGSINTNERYCVKIAHCVLQLCWQGTRYWGCSTVAEEFFFLCWLLTQWFVRLINMNKNNET